jgi:hypothetical protein
MSAIIAGCRERFPRAQTRWLKLEEVRPESANNTSSYQARSALPSNTRPAVLYRRSRLRASENPEKKIYFYMTSDQECAPILLRIELKARRNNHVNLSAYAV